MSHSNGIRSLPPELLILIAKELPIPDLKTFRLLDGNLKLIADPLLFATITFSVQERHQGQFLAICNHPIYRLHVRRLNYSVTSINLQSGPCLDSLVKATFPRTSRKQKDEFYVQFNDSALRSRNVRVYELIDLLVFGFKQLPNLKAVAFVHDLIGRSGWFTEFPWLSSAYQHYAAPWDSVKLWWNNNVVTDGHIYWTDFYVLVRSISSSGANIREFSIYETAEDGTVDISRTPRLQNVWSYVQSDYVRPCKAFFSNLVRLSLVLEADYVNLLPELLCGAHSLEELRIDCKARTTASGYYRWTADAIDIAFTLRHKFDKHKTYQPCQAVVIPKLRVLALSNFTTYGWTLLKTLEYHKNIQSLTLENVHHKVDYTNGEILHATSEVWELVLDRIKEMKLRQLSLKNISGFIRKLNDVDDEYMDERLNPDLVVEIEEHHIQRLWSLMNLWVGKIPAEYLKGEEYIAKKSISNWQVSRWVRNRIKRDQIKMDKLIMAYIKGESDINPLIGLSIHALTNWNDDELFTKALTSHD